jgi:hypothetical protein
MPVFISRPRLLFALLLSMLFCCVYFIAGSKQPLNWDEEASIDIALGIRPQFQKNSSGSLMREMPYGQVLQRSAFTSADYEKFNNAKDVVHSVWRDNSNSVLYYLALHYCIRLGGVNITMLRLLSIILAGISLLLVFLVAERHNQGSAFVPLLALVIMGSNPVFFSTAFVTRGYMLCLALLLCATYVWLGIVQSKRYSLPQLLLLGLLCAAAVLTHYFSLAVILFFFLHLAASVYRRSARNTSLPWLNLGICLVLFLTPLLFWFYISKEEGIKNLMLLDAGWLSSSKGRSWEGTAPNYLKQLFKAFTYFSGVDANNALLPRMIWQGISALMLLGIAWLTAKRVLERRRGSLFFYITAWALLLYSVKSFSAGHFMIFEKKYLLFIVPYFILAVVTCIDPFNNNDRRETMAKIAVLLVLFVPVLNFVTSAYSLQKGAAEVVVNGSLTNNKIIIPNDTRAFSLLAKQVLAQAGAVDSIVYTRWETAHRLNYFLRPAPEVQQRVDSLQNGDNLIWFKRGNAECLVEVR